MNTIDLKIKMKSTSNLLYRVLALILTIALSTVLSACKKNDSASPSNQSGQPIAAGGGGSPTNSSSDPTRREGSGGGGIDGSGGDPVLSSLTDVKDAYESQIEKLRSRLNTIDHQMEFGEVPFDYLYGKKWHSTLSRFLGFKIVGKTQGVFETAITENKLIDALYKENAVKINAQEKPCKAKDGNHAGSATGNFKKGEICISFERLQKIPKNALKQEIFYLIMHEIAHIAGYDEVQAITIQNFFAENTTIFSSKMDSEFPPRIISCDYQLLAHEIDFVNFNPYWKEKLQSISKMLMGFEKSNCGFPTDLKLNWTPRELAYKFIDDAERLPVFENFVTQFSGFELTTKARGPEKTYMSSSWEHDLSMVPAIRLETDNVILRDLKARLGSKAQCSPRVLVASVIAAIPDVIYPECRTYKTDDGIEHEIPRSSYNSEGSIKARILKQMKILEDGPEMPPLGTRIRPEGVDSW